MTILSGTKLLERIMIGEKLISPQSKKLSVEECLETIRSAQKSEDKSQMKLARELVEKYFRELESSKEDLRKRRRKIEKLVRENLLEKSRDEIINSLNVKELPMFIDDFDFKTCLRKANYDLRLGEDVYVTTERTPRKLTTMSGNGAIAIEPGEFGILMTHEYIYIPQDLMGFISVRLTYKQKGLVNISGFHADPGFYGRLMFSVYNAGPNDVVLRYKDPVFMIMLNELRGSIGKVTESRWDGMENIPIETISGLRGASVSVRNLDERIKKLETIFPVLITILVGLIGIVLTWLLTKWWP